MPLLGEAPGQSLVFISFIYLCSFLFFTTAASQSGFLLLWWTPWPRATWGGKCLFCLHIQVTVHQWGKPGQEQRRLKTTYVQAAALWVHCFSRKWREWVVYGGPELERRGVFSTGVPLALRGSCWWLFHILKKVSNSKVKKGTQAVEEPKGVSWCTGHGWGGGLQYTRLLLAACSAWFLRHCPQWAGPCHSNHQSSEFPPAHLE